MKNIILQPLKNYPPPFFVPNSNFLHMVPNSSTIIPPPQGLILKKYTPPASPLLKIICFPNTFLCFIRWIRENKSSSKLKKGLKNLPCDVKYFLNLEIMKWNTPDGFLMEGEVWGMFFIYTLIFIEVKGTYRNSILIPESGWENFRNLLDEYVKQSKDAWFTSCQAE